MVDLLVFRYIFDLVKSELAFCTVKALDRFAGPSVASVFASWIGISFQQKIWKLNLIVLRHIFRMKINVVMNANLQLTRKPTCQINGEYPDKLIVHGRMDYAAYRSSVGFDLPHDEYDFNLPQDIALKHDVPSDRDTIVMR